MASPGNQHCAIEARIRYLMALFCLGRPITVCRIWLLSSWTTALVRFGSEEEVKHCRSPSAIGVLLRHLSTQLRSAERTGRRLLWSTTLLLLTLLSDSQVSISLVIHGLWRTVSGQVKAHVVLTSQTNKPFIGFWQPRKSGLNKHTGKSCIHKIHNIHKITSLEMM